MSKQSKYDEAFKQNAVRLVTSGQKAAQVARDLGINAETLYQWVHKYRPKELSPSAGASSNGSLAKELESLRKENELLKMERDILKKAVGIFSRPPR